VIKNTVFEEVLSKEFTKGEFASLRVQFISLVKHPANRRPVLIKNSDGVFFEIPITLLRKDAAARLLYGVVYEPGLVDTQGDSAPAEVIKTAAHEFLRLGLVKMIDFQHDFSPGQGSVVESFILNGTDDRFPGVTKGAWVVAIELSENMVSHIDEIGGLSLAGQGIYRSQMPQEKSQKVLARATGKRKPLARKSF
jgi:hypothetical protein